jgi:hypothetical protein
MHRKVSAFSVEKLLSQCALLHYVIALCSAMRALLKERASAADLPLTRWYGCFKSATRALLEVQRSGEMSFINVRRVRAVSEPRHLIEVRLQNEI